MINKRHKSLCLVLVGLLGLPMQAEAVSFEVVKLTSESFHIESMQKPETNPPILVTNRFYMGEVTTEEDAGSYPITQLTSESFHLQSVLKPETSPQPFITNRFYIGETTEEGEATSGQVNQLVSESFHLSSVTSQEKRPALLTTDRFYLGEESALENGHFIVSYPLTFMTVPTTLFLANEHPITDESLIVEQTVFSIYADYTSFPEKEAIIGASYQVEAISDTGTHLSDAVTILPENDIYTQVVPITFTEGETYRIHYTLQFEGDKSYQAVSCGFYLNAQEAIVFLSPTGQLTYKETLTAQYAIGNDLAIHAYNLYLEDTQTGQRHLVAENILPSETLIETGEASSIHQWTYNLPIDLKHYKHVIEVIATP